MKTEDFNDLLMALPDLDGNFVSLVGNTYLFYGIDCNAFKLNDSVFEAEEDPDDGCRSYLGSVELKGSHNYRFQKVPLGTIRIQYVEDDYFNGYDFIDVVNGHRWLRIGTDYTEEYYPMFTFWYEPCKNAIIFK